MSNYDFSLDMNTDNSNSLILRSIKPNTTVLEMGAAHGRMTKYLKETLGCNVVVIELDEQSGKQAAQYATTSYIGKENGGDIEDYVWFDGAEKKRFDYIVFADILEHLKEPDKVLQKATELLKDDGSILVSIPNVGYNGLVIDLLNDKFEYRDTGILDKTHIKFFTHTSLKQFVAASGLTIVKENNAINTIGNSEFCNTYSQVPKEVGDYLQKRKHGEVYQFIWELKKANIELSIVTPIFNKWNFTKSYLEDLSKLDAAKVEIIVVDNASTDETQTKIMQYQSKMHNLKYIRNNENLGFGKASNIGYKASSGKYVLFLNNDIRVKEQFDNWVDALISKCTDNNLVSPTGGKVDPNNDFQFLYETNDATKDINYLSGWCIAGMKVVWDKLIEPNSKYHGPFNEDYFCYFEDTHLGFSATEKQINLTMAQVPVNHFGKVSSKQLNTFSLYQSSRTTFINKWKTK